MELDELKTGDGVYMQALISGINHDGVSEIAIRLHGESVYLNVAKGDLENQSLLVPEGKLALEQICYADAKIIDIQGRDITLEIVLENDSLEYVAKAEEIPTPEFVEDSLFSAKILFTDTYALGDFAATLEESDFSDETQEKLEKLLGSAENISGSKQGRRLVEEAAAEFRHSWKYGISDRIGEAFYDACVEAIDGMARKADKPRM